MKKMLFVLLLVISQLSWAQHQKITKLLNHQLQKEITHFYDEEEKANFIITEAFRIDENKMLHFGFTMIKNTAGEKISINRKVSMDKITGFDKDYNVYFQTLNNDVTETRTDYDKNGKILREKTEQSNLFSTEINKENYPRRFMKQMKKAITKAGYEVECNFLNP